MTPFFLSAKTAAENALRAYREGRLQFQQPEFNFNRDCLYQVPGKPNCGCAIGVSLPPELAAAADRYAEDGGAATVAQLIAEDVISTDDPTALERIQFAHDGAYVGADTETTFVNLLEEIVHRG